MPVFAFLPALLRTGLVACLLAGGCVGPKPTSADGADKTTSTDQSDPLKQVVTRTLRAQVLAEANQALKEMPRTVTDSVAARSAGGIHDFFSEGDYWWPDPANPGGPYVQRDGQTNPTNFVAHRRAMIRFSRIIGALASAYQLTRDERYARHALLHLSAWFLDPATLMNPSLLYSQAIPGKFTGRGIGVIDTIQLLEVAQGVRVFEATSPAFRSGAALAGIKQWFSTYLTWLTTHQYGLDEMNAANNHGTCWTMQVATFARLTGNQELLDFCRTRYKTVLLPTQMAPDGSFPLETRRTKPYGYSLFNLDAMTTLCAVLSTPTDDLWTYQTPDGRGIRRGIEFLHPYIQNKSAWPFAQDVMYWNDWPVAQPSLVLGAVRFDNRQWLTTWQGLNHDPQVPEVLRNLPVRHPLIWL
ncbi:alginate lyase family protein [Hymenobacter lapidiphilus]|uniref:Alginate lyase family protein n=1 Tax=Hymenobacter lapidiphilus TaxID=2608003 RepID=A0A7Y7PPX7_9BACT|nr:alginate lyase family protein [Hymenobacter lapidiphilus]NVO31856.1 alginate lyase family protein [Hymenobacter lapidiphilus]